MNVFLAWVAFIRSFVQTKLLFSCSKKYLAQIVGTRYRKFFCTCTHSPLSSLSAHAFFIFSYKFFTKGKQGNQFCPCSTACVDPAHSGENTFAQWNGKNIKKMAKGHKVVYVHCKVNKTIKTGQKSKKINFAYV